MSMRVTRYHQRLKHAAACRSTCFWDLLVGVLKHAAACCITLGWDFFWGKYRTRISIYPFAVDRQRWTVLQWLNGASVIERTLVPFLGVAICNNPGRGRSRIAQPGFFLFFLCCALTDHSFFHFVF